MKRIFTLVLVCLLAFSISGVSFAEEKDLSYALIDKSIPTEIISQSEDDFYGVWVAKYALFEGEMYDLSLLGLSFRFEIAHNEGVATSNNDSVAIVNTELKSGQLSITDEDDTIILLSANDDNSISFHSGSVKIFCYKPIEIDEFDFSTLSDDELINLINAAQEELQSRK